MRRWLFVLLILASCAGPNELSGQAGAPGFWRGVLHGVIAPITFLVSLFTDRVSMYEVHNAGHWYDFGFLVGLCAVFGSGAGGRSAFRPKRAAPDPAPQSPEA